MDIVKATPRPSRPRVDAVPLLFDALSDARIVPAQHTPLIVLFSRADCSFCHEVRTNYLAPLGRLSAHPLIVREAITDRPHRVTWSGAEQMSHAQLATKMEVRFYPTVHFIDEHLQPIIKPLLGAGMAGFYDAYLTQHIQEATRILRRI